jgi:hypothetical protein
VAGNRLLGGRNLAAMSHQAIYLGNRRQADYLTGGGSALNPVGDGNDAGGHGHIQCTRRAAPAVASRIGALPHRIRASCHPEPG